MTFRAPVELLRELASVFDTLEIPWCLGGSLASSLVGEPRATRDIDVIAELQRADVERFMARLPVHWYASEPAMIEAVRDRRSFNLVDTESGYKIDVFVRGDSAFDREEFARRAPLELAGAGGLRVPVKTAEDSILRKLSWFRDGGEASELQWRDVVALLARNRGRLDDGYLDRWAVTLALEPLLTRARSDSVA